MISKDKTMDVIAVLQLLGGVGLADFIWNIKEYKYQ